MKITRWNWGAFLLCPIWSAVHGLYIGLWSLLIPVVLGLLFFISIAKIPLLSDLFTLIAILTDFLYLALSSPLIFLGLGYVEIPILKTEIIPGIEINSGIKFDSAAVIYYLAWSIYIGMIGNQWLIKNKQKEELVKIDQNTRKWNTIGTFLFIPSIVSIGCITGSLMYEIMLLMFR